ncbi:MAG: glycosyltransferase [Cyanobacteria bacterium]|nr:glycosyltransferase [Cyanobacteriota bacterium]MDW8201891.1 glycosyltransferase [Cyanobacteriota bacterium SKYGB_h_bin112]
MNLVVLSQIHPSNRHVGFSVIHDFEHFLRSTLKPTFLYPLPNQSINVKLFKHYKFSDKGLAFLRRYRHRIFKSWYELSVPPAIEKIPNRDDPNVLLILGMTPDFLLSIHTLEAVLDQFDLKIAYLLDMSFASHVDRSVASLLDYVFVISTGFFDHSVTNLSFEIGVIPLGIDTCQVHYNRGHRPIDIFGYGRFEPSVHRVLQAHYNQSPQLERIYLHSTFSGGEVESVTEHLALHSRLLSHTKISLCFEASKSPRFQGASPLLFRWLEGWLHGCVLVGKAPRDREVAPLMDWENSTLEIPDNLNDVVPFVEALLDNRHLLETTSYRNYHECCLRHDWAYRLRDMFNTVELPIPEPITDRIRQLQSTNSVDNLVMS